MLISIIVPIYNSEKYLSRCLNSIANQTNTDFELVLINDGSTDNSEDIILDFQKNHKNLKVVYKKIPNGGQGAARELGVSLCSSKYICFVDSDDYIENDYIESFAKVINEYHPDLVCSNYFIDSEKKYDVINYGNRLLNKDDIKKEIYPVLIQTNRYEYFLPALWAKAFKKEIYFKNVCHKNIKIGEDIAVFIPTFLDSQKVYLLEKNLYHYMSNSDSIMKIKKPRSYDDVINLYEHLKDKLSDEDFKTFSLQIDRLIAHVAFNCSVTQYHSNLSNKVVKEIIDKNLSNPIISNAIKNIDAKGLKAKLMRHALKHRSYWLMKLYSKHM